jgi:hypothetical protein
VTFEVLKPHPPAYPALNRLKKGVYVDSGGTLRFGIDPTKSALLKEQASP